MDLPRRRDLHARDRGTFVNSPAIIGTLGPIGHGKSSLVHALTGTTGHVGMARSGQLAILDIGGQEPFERQLLVGNPGIDIALLCISAKALRPEVFECVQALALSPISNVVIAITQCDLSDPDMRAAIHQEITDAAAPTRLATRPIFQTSATTEEGLPKLKAVLTELSEKATSSPDSERWYLPIDRAFSVRAHGVVVSGTLAQGQVEVGNVAYLEPGHREVAVRGIQLNGTPANSCTQGQRVAINLTGIKLEDVRKGMTLAAPESMTTARAIDSEVQWLIEPTHGQRIRLSIGAETVIGKVFIDDKSSGLSQLRLETDFAVLPDQPFYVRDHTSSELLGAGLVGHIHARPSKRQERPPTVSPEDLEATILAAIGDDPRGVTTEEISKRLGLSPQAMGDACQALLETERARSFAGLWMTPVGFAEGTRRFLEALRLTHERHPTQALVPRDRAVMSASLGWTGKPLDRLMSEMVGMGKIVASGPNVRLKEFQPDLPARQRDFLDRIKLALEEHPVNVPNPYELARSLSVPPQAVEKILKLGVEAGELENLGEDIYYTQKQLATLFRRTRDLMRGRSFGVGDLKEALNTTRKYIIPLVEHMDAVHFTTRAGDNRVVRR